MQLQLVQDDMLQENSGTGSREGVASDSEKPNIANKQQANKQLPQHVTKQAFVFSLPPSDNAESAIVET